MRITIELRGLGRVLERLGGLQGPPLARAVQRGLNRAAREVATAAKHRAPYKRGVLRRVIFWEPGSDPLQPEAAIIVPPINGKPIGLWHHEGTGIYGPTGQPIRPRQAKALRFESTFGAGRLRQTKSGKYRAAPSHVQFAAQVKGIPPNPFLLDAFESARAAGVVEKEVAASVNLAIRGREPEPDPSSGEGED